MRFINTFIIGGILSLSMLSSRALAREKGAFTNLPFCIPTTIMGVSGITNRRVWSGGAKTLVDSIRYDVQAHGGGVLILSGGDINTGVPESDLQDAEPDFRGMNTVGYDAMAIGNHEFDNPLSVLRQQQKWAKFPLLSANIYQKAAASVFSSLMPCLIAWD